MERLGIDDIADRCYLELLSEKYPDEAAVCSEIINLREILALPLSLIHIYYTIFLPVLREKGHLAVTFFAFI